MTRLEAMRAKLQEDEKAKAQAATGYSRREYPLNKIDFEEQNTIRFLPDADSANPYIWKKKQVFVWNYASEEDPHEKLKVIIPCRNMYEGLEKTCPVTRKLSAMYNQGESEKKKAQPFWVKTSYVYSGFVRASKWVEPNPPENPIRFFNIFKQIHASIIEPSIMGKDPDTAVDYDPVSYTEGLDFILRKKRKGDYADYSTSNWAKKPSALTEAELAAIEQFGLPKLSEGLPPLPSTEALELQVEMLRVGLENGAWRTEWETHYKPFKRAAAQAEESDDEDEAVETKSEPSARAASILDRIKNSNYGG